VRRILLILTVVVLAAVMLVGMAGSAFANAVFECTNPDTGQFVRVFSKDKHDIAKPNGFTDCTKFTSGPG